MILCLLRPRDSMGHLSHFARDDGDGFQSIPLRVGNRGRERGIRGAVDARQKKLARDTDPSEFEMT